MEGLRGLVFAGGVGMGLLPFRAQVARGFRPLGKFEREALLEEAAGGDAAAFEDELGFGAQEEGADFEEPFGRGQAERHAPGVAELAHEVGVGQGIGRGDVDAVADGFVGDEPADGAQEIGLMDPGDELPAGAVGAAEAEADEPQEHVERAAVVGAHDDGGAEEDEARAVGGGFLARGVFPGGGRRRC